MRPVVYDAGPLIAAERNERRFWAEHRARLELGIVPLVPAAVTVVEGPFRGSLVNCSVGSDDYGFLVGWWDGSALWVRRVDVAP